MNINPPSSPTLTNIVIEKLIPNHQFESEKLVDLVLNPNNFHVFGIEELTLSLLKKIYKTSINASSERLTENLKRKLNETLKEGSGAMGISEEEAKRKFLSYFHKFQNDEPKITPFHRLCVNGNYSIVNFFIESVEDINLPTQQGWTPLMLAIASFREIALIEMLMKYGADVNQVNEKNNLSPLHLCLLLKYMNFPGDANIKDKSDRSKKMYNCLVENGAQIIRKGFLTSIKDEGAQAFMNKFSISLENKDKFYDDVKKAGARELYKALSKNHSNEALFELIQVLKGEMSDVVNIAVQLDASSDKASPFEYACAALKGMEENANKKSEKKKAREFFEKFVRELMFCGARFEQNSTAYKNLYSTEEQKPGNSTLKGRLEGYRGELRKLAREGQSQKLRTA